MSGEDLTRMSPNHRLSTILEVSCEESPLKKASSNALKEYNSKQPKIQTLSEELPEKGGEASSQANGEEEKEESELVEDLAKDADQDRRTSKILDVDSLPIGFKPTNKMSFEQLIEEKLKIADQLDREQFSNTTSSKAKRPNTAVSKTREKFVQAKVIRDNNVKPAVPPPAPLVMPPPQKPEKSTTTTTTAANEPDMNNILPTNVKQPKKYLKRGEGLKRYQAPSVKSAQKTTVRNVFS